MSLGRLASALVSNVVCAHKDNSISQHLLLKKSIRNVCMRTLYLPTRLIFVLALHTEILHCTAEVVEDH